MRPASSGIAIPDVSWAEIRLCKIMALAICGALIVGCIAALVLIIPALTMGWAAGLLSGLSALVPLSLMLFFLIPARMRYEASQRDQLSDALVLAGHPGVDVLRLQAGKPVPSPQRVQLRLRRERDDAGRRWLLVDAVPYAPEPGSAEGAGAISG
jgi:hypothetical protein